MFGEDVLGEEGNLFGEIKSECRFKEDWHIMHCEKQNVLLLKCVAGEAVKPKISCEKNGGMGSNLTEYMTETFRAFPKIL